MKDNKDQFYVPLVMAVFLITLSFVCGQMIDTTASTPTYVDFWYGCASIVSFIGGIFSSCAGFVCLMMYLKNKEKS